MPTHSSHCYHLHRLHIHLRSSRSLETRQLCCSVVLYSTVVVHLNSVGSLHSSGGMTHAHISKRTFNGERTVCQITGFSHWTISFTIVRPYVNCICVRLLSVHSLTCCTLVQYNSFITVDIQYILIYWTFKFRALHEFVCQFASVDTFRQL